MNEWCNAEYNFGEQGKLKTVLLNERYCAECKILRTRLRGDLLAERKVLCKVKGRINMHGKASTEDLITINLPVVLGPKKSSVIGT